MRTLPLRLVPGAYAGRAAIDVSVAGVRNAVPHARRKPIDRRTLAAAALLPPQVVPLWIGAAIVRPLRNEAFYPFMRDGGGRRVTAAALRLVCDR